MAAHCTTALPKRSEPTVRVWPGRLLTWLGHTDPAKVIAYEHATTSCASRLRHGQRIGDIVLKDVGCGAWVNQTIFPFHYQLSKVLSVQFTEVLGRDPASFGSLVPLMGFALG